MAQDSIATRRLQGAGVELAVQVAGSGTPVVFLHGFPENAGSWEHQMRAVVNAGFSAWAPDLRGYRASDRPAAQDAYHLRHLMADVAAIVRSTGAPRAHIVGHDWGGVIAWGFAGHYAAMVDRLVILNAPHLKLYREKVWRSSQALRSWYVGLFLIPGLAERTMAARDFALMRQMFRAGAGGRMPFTRQQIEDYIAQFRSAGALTAAIDYYRANALSDGMRLGATSRVAAETLVLWGERDKALASVLLDGLERVAPRARVHRFPDVGHWIQHEARDEVNRLLTEFLSKR